CRFRRGVQPVPAQQAQLLDHHERWHGAVGQQQRHSADELLKVGRYSAYRRGSDTVPPDVIDRILVGACAAGWLGPRAVSGAAGALTDVGQGFHKVSRSPHTTWVLYVVIVVSALIIAGAIPVLLRARRTAQGETPASPAGGLLRGAAGRPIRPGNPNRRTVAE